MTTVTDMAAAVLLGGALAFGLLGMLSALPRWGALSLERRIAPYVRDVVPDEALPAGILPVVGIMPVRPRRLWDRVRTTFERMLGGGEALRLRLSQAGVVQTPAAFRGRQLAWGVAGLVAGAVLVVVIAVAGRMTAPAVLLPVLAGAGAAAACDMQLTARAKSRRARLADELPTTLEFLALCLSAGESLLDALRRVSTIGSGELTNELKQTVLAVHTGSPLADALGETATRLQLPGLTRAIDQIIAALEHGAPLAGVLHSQAADAREEAKRVLIEQAGQKEILMMLPLVFLILPLSVLFAVYPGLFILRLGLS
ncbi:Type II/IV secretion system protein TadC, associated with Flp pilus assembly [Microbacterium esteraromaticum]|uniref:Type II/IV secretion system protein TadC, associated with Flp pilus assembly n=1 Tax=Microbacterium esteraromaticum TaxID=57043 RepID=A0A1R4KSZ1_9MICO|nr:type II secretion system F family protein [Microbacterium esteraromaticum]SJN47382.1 Type II/IV secretion system protein TadC, associated with Flp pilus assembly [Microbacterium esteraromaticum]